MGHSGKFLAEQILKDDESTGPKKTHTILLRKRIKELRSVFLFNAVRPELHLSQAKHLITRSYFWTLFLFFLDYFLLSVVCEKFCPLFGSCIKLWQKVRYLVCAGSGPPLRSPWGLICWAPSSSQVCFYWVVGPNLRPILLIFRNQAVTLHFKL